MPANQFFSDWVTGDIITATKLNQMKNDVQPYLGYVPVSVNQGGDSTLRYYYLGRISNNNGIFKVRGILGGHTITDGRANIDLQFTYRDVFRADGYVMGTMNRADILVHNGGDGWAYVYLVTGVWALVNLELSKQGNVEIQYNGSYSTSAPGGSTLYWLGNDFIQNTHASVLKLNDGVLQTRYDHRDRFVVDAHLGGTTSLVMGPGSSYWVRSAIVRLPLGQKLYLKRLRIHLPASIFARIITAYATYTSTTDRGEIKLDVQLSGDWIYGDFSIRLGVYNVASDNRLLYPYDSYTAEFELR